MAGRNTLDLIRSLVGFGLGRESVCMNVSLCLSLSLSKEMYGERAWQSSLLRSGPLNRQENAATAGATALLRYHYPQRCASERASEQARAEACRRLAGRWGPGRRPTFCCARLGQDVELHSAKRLWAGASCRRETAVPRDRCCGALYCV